MNLVHLKHVMFRQPLPSGIKTESLFLEIVKILNILSYTTTMCGQEYSGISINLIQILII